MVGCKVLDLEILVRIQVPELTFLAINRYLNLNDYGEKEKEN